MRCGICPNRYRCVAGDGPSDARVVTIGEAPGREEDAGGRPFIGQAGREFNENYLALAGLSREEVYVTNTVKCRPDLNRKPSYTEAIGCSSHFLPDELATINPEVVVLMGATACSLVAGGIDLEAEHGIPRLGELYGWVGWVVPVYHPAAGLHDTSMMIPMLEDWERLRGWLEKGTWVWPVVESTSRDYALIETVVEAEEFLHRCHYLPVPYLIGGDSESHDGVPYSWQLSLETGVARMLMLKNTSVCKVVSDWLRDRMFWDGRVADFKTVDRLVFHYAPADLDIFEAQLQATLDGVYRDTMLEAYGFGSYGKLGLKTLARRVLGRSRLSWEETVTPWSKEVLGQWIMNGYVHAESAWQTVIERAHKKTGKPLKPKVVASVPEKLLREILTYSIGNDDYPIWQKLEERMPVEWMERLVAECGPVPARGIAHCPIDVQIEYACSDPDDTRQLAIEFDRLRGEFVESLNIQPEDVDP